MKYRKSPKSNNGIGTAIQICGAMVIMFGILLSLGLAMPKKSSWYRDDDFNWGIALGGSILSVASGMGLLAVGEVLCLLQTSCDMEYTILLHLRGEEETEEGAGTDSAAAAVGAGPVPPVSAKTEPSGKGTFSAAPTSAAARPAAARPGAASGGGIQFCPHCGAKQSSPAAKCWHCGGTLTGR